MGCLKIRLLSKYRSVCTTFLCLLDLICEHHQPSPNPPNHQAPRKKTLENPASIRSQSHPPCLSSRLPLPKLPPPPASTPSTSWMARQIARMIPRFPKKWDSIWKQGAISSQQDTSRLQSFKSPPFFAGAKKSGRLWKIVAYKTNKISPTVSLSSFLGVGFKKQTPRICRLQCWPRHWKRSSPQLFAENGSISRLQWQSPAKKTIKNCGCLS